MPHENNFLNHLIGNQLLPLKINLINIHVRLCEKIKKNVPNYTKYFWNLHLFTWHNYSVAVPFYAFIILSTEEIKDIYFSMSFHKEN